MIEKMRRYRRSFRRRVPYYTYGPYERIDRRWFASGAMPPLFVAKLLPAGAAETPDGLKNPMAAVASIAIMITRIFASSLCFRPTELVLALRSFGSGYSGLSAPTLTA